MTCLEFHLCIAVCPSERTELMFDELNAVSHNDYFSKLNIVNKVIFFIKACGVVYPLSSIEI